MGDETMFREMRRKNQELTELECFEVLKNAPRGVLAIHGEDGYPYAIPMNHFYHNDKLYFHCAKMGHKIDALSMNDKVSFCVMDEGYRKENEWSLNIKSVVIFGTIRMMDLDANAMEMLRNLGIKHYPSTESVDEVMQQASARVQMLELSIDYMSGKLVNES